MGVGASLLSQQLSQQLPIALTFALSGVFLWTRQSWSLGRSLEKSEPSSPWRIKKIERKVTQAVNVPAPVTLVTQVSKTAEELMRLGVRYGDQGSIDKAMVTFVESKAAFEDDNACETSCYAELLVQIAICYSMQGRKKEEMEKYQEAQKVFQKAKCTGTRGYAGLLKNMGIWFMEHDQMDEAMEKFQEAESRYVFANAAGSSNYAGLLTSMGKWLLNAGSEVEAMVKFKEAKIIYEALGQNNYQTEGVCLCECLFVWTFVRENRS
jgi:tetratricopeptide (TPR) repeat protein